MFWYLSCHDSDVMPQIKLMISVLSAVAEIERENIRIQTMEGRMQKAREGKWNGGFAPYGYKLVGGKLEINEKEAEAIRVIFVDGIHEAIISEDVWEQARIKVAVQAKKYEKVNSVKGEKIYLLSGLLKCPICGAGMYGNKSIKSRKDGTWQFFFFVVRPAGARSYRVKVSWFARWWEELSLRQSNYASSLVRNRQQLVDDLMVFRENRS